MKKVIIVFGVCVLVALYYKFRNAESWSMVVIVEKAPDDADTQEIKVG